MEEQQKQLIARLKDAQNVLVTVSKDPSVDQLAAAIGLTLALNKLNKHATAVYSGKTPSTIEFLKPEETLETNTDSLRDFIIALDRSKADKLRYKAEANVVRIFITPYKTSISDKDLEFSQGDFNVDVVVALGVKTQVDLDEAITAHGRILHHATVSSISIDGQTELGTLNVVSTASSLCEVVTNILGVLDKKIVDAQIATALLTGIVAMTERFSNDRTTPDTMSSSAALMAAGANQQLIANELAEPVESEEPVDQPSAEDIAAEPPKEPGTLEISHEETAAQRQQSASESEEPVPSNETQEKEAAGEDKEDESKESSGDSRSPQIQVDEDGKLMLADEKSRIRKVRSVGDSSAAQEHTEPLLARERMIEPPSRSGRLTANAKAEDLDVSTEELTLPPVETPMLSHDDTVLAPSDEATPSEESAPDVPASPEQPELASPKIIAPEQPTSTPAKSALRKASSTDAPSVGSDSASEVIDTEEKTLTDIEKAVDSPHAAQKNEAEADQNVADQPSEASSIDDARSAVEAAFAASKSETPQDPIAALNAKPLGSELHSSDSSDDDAQSSNEVADQTLDVSLPEPSSGTPPSPVSVSQGAEKPASDAGMPPPPSVPPPPIFPNT
ncbi:hypothetical protein CSA80_04465 [Candidatus Saccharibacteria bacterium]|nr:MAG: hypothetical protein CR973_01460 [Candidatus Saccharibacteria bacterium]PID98921.1 MAG: hypothetical protein CSA80_04465 [Candidatus Saccharibacteria bacterium]